MPPQQPYIFDNSNIVESQYDLESVELLAFILAGVIILGAGFYVAQKIKNRRQLRIAMPRPLPDGSFCLPTYDKKVTNAPSITHHDECFLVPKSLRR